MKMLTKRQATHNKRRKLPKKTKNCKKIRKIVPIFAIFCHNSQQKMIQTHKTETIVIYILLK